MADAALLDYESPALAASDCAARAPLPRTRFGPAPGPGTARRLAHLTRRALTGETDMPVDVTALIDVLGWRTERARLRAAEGGTQALLIPSTRGDFCLVVDPRPAPGQRASPRVLWSIRAAHEVGHVFFYRRGCPPRRSLPANPAEEDFCDAFAAALLDGPRLPAAETRALLNPIWAVPSS